MSDDSKAPWITLASCIAMAIIWLMGSWTGWHLGRESQYKHCVDEAVYYGHAEYYLDANFNKQWRWKPLP